MSEAEILQGLLASVQVIMSLFSIFFTLTSAYIAGLYFFLHRAPVALRLLAFFLLSVGLVFLGGSATVQQRVQEGLFSAWQKLPTPIMNVQSVRNPFPLPAGLPAGWSFQDVGIVVGWVTALGVYLALAYLTFFYRWRSREGTGHA